MRFKTTTTIIIKPSHHFCDCPLLNLNGLEVDAVAVSDKEEASKEFFSSVLDPMLSLFFLACCCISVKPSSGCACSAAVLAFVCDLLEPNFRVYEAKNSSHWIFPSLFKSRPLIIASMSLSE